MVNSKKKAQKTEIRNIKPDMFWNLMHTMQILYFLMLMSAKVAPIVLNLTFCFRITNADLNLSFIFPLIFGSLENKDLNNDFKYKNINGTLFPILYESQLILLFFFGIFYLICRIIDRYTNKKYKSIKSLNKLKLNVMLILDIKC